MDWPLSPELADQVLGTAVLVLLAKDQASAARILLNARVRIDHIPADEESGLDYPITEVTLLFPPRIIERAWEALGSKGLSDGRTPIWDVLEGAFSAAIDGVVGRGGSGQMYFDTGVAIGLPSANWRTEIAGRLSANTPTNQARVSTQVRKPPFDWNGLAFQSATEVRIAKALSNAEVLFFPLPAAVAGVKKKEPDFLVCAAGKWGILEIHGDQFHTPETAASEHDRGRWFQKYGLRVFQIYDAVRCYSHADDVVKEFLHILRES